MKSTQNVVIQPGSHCRKLLLGIYNACRYKTKENALVNRCVEDPRVLRTAKSGMTANLMGFILRPSSSRSVSMRDIGAAPRGFTTRGVLPQGRYAGYSGHCGFTHHSHPEFISGSSRSVRAFTLIELLVVVLIIGILAAVAVPQYKLAVAKSQYIQAMVVGDAIYKAQQLYFLEHGSYAQNMRDLADSLPSGGKTNGVVISYDRNNKPFVTCSISNPTAPYCRLDFYGQLYYIVHIEEGRRFCYVADPNDFPARVCKSLSPKNSNSLQTFEL